MIQVENLKFAEYNIAQNSINSNNTSKLNVSFYFDQIHEIVNKNTKRYAYIQ